MLPRYVRSCLVCSSIFQRTICSRSLSNFITRPPVVTVMGHVDHGKTTLLDSLRTTNVAAGEAGGITQKISVFQHIDNAGDTFTFIDTPGHAAFTKMRLRGSLVTDIVILVVAATEGVMPQTVESIQHIKAAGVPVIVAINKIDQPHANIKTCIEELAEYGIVAEELGGDVQAIKISALKGINLDHLVESLKVQCMFLDLKADTSGLCKGTVVEVNKGKGASNSKVTVLIQEGSLKRDDFVVSETTGARVKNLQSIEGDTLDLGLPGMPVMIQGWKDLPKVGDDVLQTASSSETRALLKEKKDLLDANRKELIKMGIQPNRMKKRVSFMLQADSVGSLEVIKDMLNFNNKYIEINIFQQKLTPFTTVDIQLAELLGAHMICFNSPGGNLKTGIYNCFVHNYDVIYHLAEAIERELQPLVPILIRQKMLGSGVIAELHGWEKRTLGLKRGLQLSKTARKAAQDDQKEENKTLEYGTKYKGKFPTIAGIQISSGVFQKNAKIAIKRQGESIWEGPCSNLRFFQEDIDVTASSECGIAFSKVLNIRFKVGDDIICYLEKPYTTAILSENFGVHQSHSSQLVKTNEYKQYKQED